ncbi:MAG: hypothetical protein UW12_C0043G0016, partial [Parcubacteria group bacterium GW2011_GWF1_43_9]
NFLDKIDPDFALRLKDQGRLEGFRSFLRKIWVSLDGSSSPGSINKLARQFGDELQEEYGKTKEEWSEIDKDLIKWLTGTTGISAIASAVAKGGMDWQMPAMGFCVNGVLSLLQARTARGNFKNNVPLAVFLDLEKKGKIFK